MAISVTSTRSGKYTYMYIIYGNCNAYFTELHPHVFDKSNVPPK